MSTLVLTSEQQNTLRKYGEEFVAWLKTEDGQENVGEHREHERYFKDKLSEENIGRLTEEEFGQLYKTLWASEMWSNKDWYVSHKLIAPNGLAKIKTELSKLLYGDSDIAARYDEFRNNIAGFGSSSISEILHAVFPDKYCLWNDKPKTVLPFLRIGLLPQKFFKYQISYGDDYVQVVQALDALRNELRQFGVTDFIDLDLFFWHIFTAMPRMKGPGSDTMREEDTVIALPLSKIKIDSHQGAEFYLLELGRTLGYLPYTVDQSENFQGKRLGDVAMLQQIPSFAGDRDMRSAKEIDVLWFNEEENPEYCFEVEHTTDIVHGLDRLIQLQHLYVKFVIVAPEEKRTKYESLLERVQYRRIRDRFRFISYEELASLLESAVPFHQLRTKLLGED